MNITMLIGLGIKISLFLTVLGYGLRVPANEAFYLFQKPGLLVRTLLSMNVIMPLFVIGMALTFELPLIVRASLIALSVSPVPPLFPGKPLKAGGRESYITGLLVASTLFSIILIPATFILFERIFHRHTEVAIDKIITNAFTLVIVPLALAMLIRRLAPTFSVKAAHPVSKFATILLVVCFLPVLVTIFPAIRSLIGNGTVLSFVAFALVGVTVGHLLGGPAEEDRTVLALSTATRHPGIAIALANTNQPDHKLVAAAVVLYLLISGVIALPYLKLLRRDKPKLASTSGNTLRT